jgi:hypothetical protein
MDRSSRCVVVAGRVLVGASCRHGARDVHVGTMCTTNGK